MSTTLEELKALKPSWENLVKLKTAGGEIIYCYHISEGACYPISFFGKNNERNAIMIDGIEILTKPKKKRKVYRGYASIGTMSEYKKKDSEVSTIVVSKYKYVSDDVKVKITIMDEKE